MTRMGGTYVLSESTMLTIRVASSVLQGIGIIFSLLRLWFRLRIRRVWWEDMWSSVACICAVVLLVSQWMYLVATDWWVSVAGYLMYALALTCVVWAVRMSMLFSIARIVYSSEHMRRLVTVVAIFFSLVFLAFTSMKIWWYTRDLSWLKNAAFYTKPACWLPRWMYVYELCTDCISDAILISLPVRLLWKVNLPTRQRRMIISIFSASIIVTMISIFRAITQIMNLLSLVGVATDFEAAFSTINCNLLVIATLIYRISRSASGSDVSESDSENDGHTTSAGNGTTPRLLTTVDLSLVESSKDDSQLAAT